MRVIQKIKTRKVLDMAKEKKDKHKKDHSKDKKRKREEEDESKHAENARRLVSRHRDVLALFITFQPGQS